MTDKTYVPETIVENPFPVSGLVAEQEVSTADASLKIGGDTNLSPGVEIDRKFPERVVAVATISETINTQEKKILGLYNFGELGALKVGAYVNGVSGEIKISPDGIVAKNVNGVTTFSLDGTTGDATFMGSLMAGSIITGSVTVGNNSVIIDGANKRIIVNDGTNDRVLIGFQSGGF